MDKIKLLEKYKEQAYKNAVRLFKDASLLYTHDSYPSSCYLAIASYEEIGKVHVIDRMCDAMCLNPEHADDIYNTWNIKARTTNHKRKQNQAMFDANGYLPSFPINKNSPESFVYSGGLEELRKQAIYVEMFHKDIGSPHRITPSKAFSILKLCFEAFKGTDDTGFNGFNAYSNQKTEWLAKQELSIVELSMQQCESHNKSKGIIT